MGTVAIFDDDVQAIPGAYLIQFRLATRPITTRYIFYFLKSPVGQSYLTGKGAGIAQPNLNAPTIDVMKVPLPPLAEQTRIVSEVERRLSVLEELESVVVTNLQRGKSLRGSILASGFRSGRGTERSAQPAKANPTIIQPKGIHSSPIISPMKKQTKVTPESVVDTVRRNKEKIKPSDLCLAFNVEEEVEAFFEVLRECRDRGLLIVPSGIGSIIKLAES